MLLKLLYRRTPHEYLMLVEIWAMNLCGSGGGGAGSDIGPGLGNGVAGVDGFETSRSWTSRKQAELELEEPGRSWSCRSWAGA